MLEGTEVKKHEVVENKISPELKSALAKVPAGDIITIENRRVEIEGVKKRLPILLYCIMAE